jgi:hypothetical protein
VNSNGPNDPKGPNLQQQRVLLDILLTHILLQELALALQPKQTYLQAYVQGNDFLDGYIRRCMAFAKQLSSTQF